MELTLGDVAVRHGVTQRAVQQAVALGQLAPLRRVGKAYLVDDLAAQAWMRSSSRGRRWSAVVREAALDLLTSGTTRLISGPEKSRLARRLRVMDARGIAHASGGLGIWARYSTAESAPLDAIGPSAVAMSELGILEGESWLSFGRTEDLDAFETEHDVILSADGNLGIVERSEPDNRLARVLLDAYLLGDARVSAATAVRLEECASAL